MVQFIGKDVDAALSECGKHAKIRREPSGEHDGGFGAAPCGECLFEFVMDGSGSDHEARCAAARTPAIDGINCRGAHRRMLRESEIVIGRE